MTKESQITKVHYKGHADDFLVFVDSQEELKKWKDDKSIPLAQVVSVFKIYLTHSQGAQGSYDIASHQVLEAEFGTHNEDEVIKMILEKGDLQASQFHERQGTKNESMGGRAPH